MYSTTAIKILMKDAIAWRRIPLVLWLCMLLAMSFSIASAQKATPASKKGGTAELIFSNIQAALHSIELGTLQEDPYAGQLPNSINTWFHTEMFTKALSVHSIVLHPNGHPDQDRIYISAFQFANDSEAADAVAHMDRHGLRRVAYLAPANWFWIGFRDSVLFLSCKGLRVEEEPYQSVIKVVLMEVQRLRVEGVR